MNKIKRNETETAKKEIEKALENHTNISQRAKIKLEKLGYQEICLGTGKQSYSSSKVIKTWELKNSFATGMYFGVGISNLVYGKGYKYFAYVKEVV